MNDYTPRKYRGSLLERAAEQFHYGPQPVTLAEPAPRKVAPPVAPAPEPVVAPVVEAAPVELVPEPVFEVEPLELVPEPVAEAPVEPVAMPISVPEPVLELVPEPQVQAPEPRRSHSVAPEAVIPPAQPFTGRQLLPIDRQMLEDSGMIVPGAPITPLAEEFRMVKRQLLLTARAVAAKNDAKAADRARMVLVCSAQANEGKTFCAINLALSMAAEKDVEILLVDADIAKPDLPARLGLPQSPGLLDVLTGAVDSVEECIIDTDIPQLSILPAGTRSHSDTELLASDRARAVLDGLAAANPRRIVIFDSPPALAASPASVLALHAGQVMLVVRADRTSESELREAVKQLEACEHIQLVLNSVSFQSGRSRFGSYYGEAGQ